MANAQQAWKRLSTEIWNAVNTKMGDASQGDASGSCHDSSASDPAPPVLIPPSHQRRTSSPNELIYTASRGNFRAASASLDAAFPVVDEAALFALFPSVGGTGPGAAYEQAQIGDARRCVRAALDEMRLNYDLDPGLLGERSEVSRGYAQIAWLLTHLRLAHSAADDQAQEEHTRLDPIPDEQPASSVMSGKSKGRQKRPFETHDLLKAIDRHDVETIIEIRDSAFDLLLDITTGAATTGISDSRRSTPLGYAMGLGPAYEDVCIVIIGTLSRFVNQLPDVLPSNNKVSLHDPLKQTLDSLTMSRLRKIRTNLKLAIDTSLALKQTSLLASYCQVLIMSEGNTFIHNAVAEVQHALQHRLRGSAGQDDPFAVGQSALLKFFTQNLRSEQKQRMVGQAQEYIDNAVGDLFLMALWGLVMLSPREARGLTVEALQAQGAANPEEEADALMTEQDESKAVVPPMLALPIPTYYFARDERVSACFVERVRLLDEASYTRARNTVLASNRARSVALELATMGRTHSTQRLALLRQLVQPA